MSDRVPPPMRGGLSREQWSAHDLGARAPFRTRRAPSRGLSAASASVSEAAADPALPLALSDLFDLRRLGLFDGDGRTPPSWIDR